jgi:hypothetical protein
LGLKILGDKFFYFVKELVGLTNKNKDQSFLRVISLAIQQVFSGTGQLATEPFLAFNGGHVSFIKS